MIGVGLSRPGKGALGKHLWLWHLLIACLISCCVCSGLEESRVDYMMESTLALSGKISPAFSTAIAVLRITARVIREERVLDWTGNSDVELTSLTKVVDTSGTYPWGMLVDENSDRRSEFIVTVDNEEPPSLPSNFPYCPCLPSNTSWLDYCNKFFPGQTVCSSCEAVCNATSYLALSRILEILAPSYCAHIPESISWALGTEEWLRVLVLSGSLAPYGITIADLGMERNPFWKLVAPKENSLETASYGDPLYSSLIQAVEVGIGYPIWEGNTFIMGTLVMMSLKSTETILESFPLVSGQFSFLMLSDGGFVIGSTIAYPIIFGEARNLSRSYTIAQASANFSNILSNLNCSFCYVTLSLNDTRFVITYTNVTDTPWILCVGTPESYFKSATSIIPLVVAIPAAFVVVLVAVVGILTVVSVRYKNKASLLAEKVDLFERGSGTLLGTPAEYVIKELMALNKVSKIPEIHKKKIMEIVGIISSNKLYKADFISKKQLGELDAETDLYVLTTLLGATGGPSEPTGPGVPLSTIGTSSMEESLPRGFSSWDFDVAKMFVGQQTNVVFSTIATHLLKEYGLIDFFHFELDKVMSYFQQVEAGYFKKNPYHTAVHAVDVAQAMHSLLQAVGPHHFTNTELLAAIFSTFIHDYLHPGVNNGFLYASLDALALKYNGISILESMHVSEAFNLLFSRPEINFLAAWPKAQIQDFHRLVVALVLSTDMSKHIEIIGQLKAIRASSHELDYTKQAERELCLKILLKLADISNAIRKWSVAQTWAECVMEEFFQQGEHERENGLPISPFMDRKTTNIAKAQSTFIDFVETPFVEVVSQILPPGFADTLHHNLQDNSKRWATLLTTTQSKTTSSGNSLSHNTRTSFQRPADDSV
ncbi:cAMP phosphodiesterase [Pelomyxa schiedti]|nr:cAMP phosphodiesterase [Pelomyxa schiedti]